MHLTLFSKGNRVCASSTAERKNKKPEMLGMEGGLVRRRL
jgi:hypothetical protein